MMSSGERHAAGEPWSRPEQIRAAIDWVGAGLIERDEPARALVLAAICGEHLLLIGPPGTAKSALASRLHGLVGGRYFERLLTRFTVPEELFGPLSLAALDAGRYERETEGYLPTASVAFLDEVFKANSAILNALLSLLNERVFEQGSARVEVPLICLVAASNDVPDDEGLRAFHDRFMLRCAVAPVSDAAFGRLLDVDPDELPASSLATLGVRDARGPGRRVRDVALSEELRHALFSLRSLMRDIAAPVSDRRWVRALRCVRIAALVEGAEQIGWEHLFVLKWLLPETAGQAARVHEWWAEQLGACNAVEPRWLERVVEAFSHQLEIEEGMGEIAFDDSGKLALAQRIGGADSAALGDGVARLSAFSRRRRFSASHLRARLAQIDGVLAHLDVWLAGCQSQRERLLVRLGDCLWIPPTELDRMARVLESSAQRVSALRDQLVGVRRAFSDLPVAERDDGCSPEPVPLP